MAWNPTYFSALAFLSAGLFGTLIVVGVRRRWSQEAPAFVALMAGAFVWSFVYGIQLGFTSAASQALWQRATLGASAFIPPIFLVFALRYSGWADWLTRRRIAILLGEACLFAALALTNPYHRLVWTDATLHPRFVSPALDISFGPIYYAHIVVAYLVVLMAIGVLLTVFFRRESVSHNQAGLLVLGAGPALLTHALYSLKLTPLPGLDLTPFVFVFTGVLYSLALFHFDLLERMPIAQQRALEIMGDGLLVVDDELRFVNTNPVAERVLGVTPDGDGRVTDELDVEHVTELDGTTRTVITDGERYTYDLHVSSLTDQYGGISGYAIVLRDVTDRYAYEERLEVTNRVLRHNLRNDMNVIEGYARLLEDAAPSSEYETYASTIREKAADLIDLSEKARQMITIRQQREPGEPPTDAVAVVESLVSDLRDDHPEVAVAVDVTDRAPVATITEQALEVAIGNLLENAVRHNPEAHPAIDVSVERVADRVHVAVSDNGPGLPSLEQAVLREDLQTPLQHSQGLGLWLTHWIVTTTGGEIDLQSSPETGTTISLLLEAADTDEAMEPR